MSSRNNAFSSDPESSSVLKGLGYSEEEISGTPGEATEDDLRTSLRQLSAEKSSTVQREHQPDTPPNPKFQKQQRTPDSDDYWQGRKDEAAARKSNQNQAPAPRKQAPKQAPPQTRQAKQAFKQLSRIAKTFTGTSPGKTLGGVAKAQKVTKRSGKRGW